MKVPESGMPEEQDWARFFDVEGAMDAFLAGERAVKQAVEFGCGYGTFTVALARRSNGHVTALDIEPEMVAATQGKAVLNGTTNIHARQRDFITGGTGLAAASQTDALVFNILHLERPLALLQEVHRVLQPGGQISLMHWRTDVPTPRGPPLSIRPTPSQCEQWLVETGFLHVHPVDLTKSCPYHYGLIATR
ncbi:methyltransferase family protein [Luteibacter rhizovicinus]|uniref:Methyltransferase family protein n=2 Tax=Luteibacter rhizovicinus TaxID=242606 RepID=A0A4R3YYJ5_9GAMM|nr:methyltransferase family protein [Luteibacter rhizovicinus]